jgi:hypothetical protein
MERDGARSDADGSVHKAGARLEHQTLRDYRVVRTALACRSPGTLNVIMIWREPHSGQRRRVCNRHLFSCRMASTIFIVSTLTRVTRFRRSITCSL